MKKLLLSVLPILFLNACWQSESHIKISQSTSIVKLRKMVDFPLDIKSAKWELKMIDNEYGLVPGPSDYFLSAEISCDSLEMKKFKTDFIKDKTNLLYDGFHLSQVFIKKWFPDEKKAFFYKKSGGDFVRVSAYKINRKIVGQTFFLDGWFIFIGKDKIFMSLSTS